MVKEDAEIGAFVRKTAQSVRKKSVVCPKSTFSLFVTTPVVSVCKCRVKVEYGPTGGKSVTTALTSDGTEGLQEKPSFCLVTSHQPMSPSRSSGVRFAAGSAGSRRSGAPGARDSSCLSRTQPLPAAGGFVGSASAVQCCPSCSLATALPGFPRKTG